MIIKIFFLGNECEINGKNLLIRGSHPMVFALSRFLDDNADPDTRLETIRADLRYIEFEIEDKFFKNLVFSKT